MSKKEKVNGGVLAAQVMKNAGITHLFGLVGGHVYGILAGCADAGIRIIDVRHEESAAHMAEGWALATGRPAACIGTAGPGFTNMLTGIANAFAGSAPMLAFGGRVTVKEFDTGALQDFNQLDVVKPMTKYARAVYETERIPEYVGKALREATTGRPGPAYIEIPMDRLYNKVDDGSVRIPELLGVHSPPAGNPEDIERAIELIDQAKKPVVVAGGGVWWAQAQDDLKAFIEKTGMPLFTRSAARGCVPDDHPQVIGLASGFHPGLQAALAQGDLLIMLGTRFNFLLEAKQIPDSMKLIRVDVEPSAICDGRTPDVGIVGDAGVVLRQLTQGVKQQERKEWVDQLQTTCDQAAQMMEPLATSGQVPIHPLRLFREVSRFVDRDTVVVIDGGDMTVWGIRTLPATGPGQFLSLTSSIFACLGMAVPFGIAAKLAHPDKKVIVTTGDGSFGLTCMEYDTAIRHNIPFVTVIGNDQSWGMIERDFKRYYGKTVACHLAPRRYDKIVEAMGGHGEYVEDPDEIGPAIERALDSGRPACVNVMIDPEISPGIWAESELVQLDAQ